MTCLVIRPDGQVDCTYTEAVDLSALGRCRIRRASHVEADDQGRWWADLGPVDGPLLGPFDRRRQALAAEQAWLEGLLFSAATPQPDPGHFRPQRRSRRIPIRVITGP